MAATNPIRAGFAQALRSLGLTLIEIAWRWAFGVGAILLLLAGFYRLVAGLDVTAGEEAAFRSGDAQLAAAAILQIFHGTGDLFIRAALILAPIISIWWIVTATMGRMGTLKILLPGGSSRNAAQVLRSNILRATAMWTGILLWFAIIGFASIVSYKFSSSDEPNLLVYFVFVILFLPPASVWWAIMSWRLSLAPLFSFRDGKGGIAAYRQVRKHVREHRAEFVKVNLVFGVMRAVAVVVLIAACAIVGSVATGRSGIAFVTAVIVVLSLIYFAVADFLSVARLGAYVAILSSRDSAVPVTAATARPVVPAATS
jgi:hypothetical protein